MQRREFIGLTAKAAALCASMRNDFMLAQTANGTVRADDPYAVLEGTTPLQATGDLALQMVDGIHRYLHGETEKQSRDRERFWSRDYSTTARYQESVEPNRQRFRQIIGAVDERVKVEGVWVRERVSEERQIAQEERYRISAISWPVFANPTADSSGLDAEGLLLQPSGPPIARVVAIPDADWSPEALAGLTDEIPRKAQFARRLAEHGVQVIVPLITNRQDTFSGIPGVGMTNMPHREWIYRMAFEVGRHIIGFEVQQILAAVDWFAHENEKTNLPIGVIGYGEGGLLALYAAAIDTRIDSTVVSGYFQPRENLWQEPIYRDLWGLLREFGDAELAGLIAPRALIVEACRGPEVTGPPKADAEHQDLACPNGRLTTPPLELVQKEFERARPYFEKLHASGELRLIAGGDANGDPGSNATLLAFLHSLRYAKDTLQPDGAEPVLQTECHDPTAGVQRQFNALVDYTQALIRRSPAVRKEFWKRANPASIPSWAGSTQFYRNYIWDEVIGRMPAPSLPPAPRSRLIFDEPKFRGYEVVLDVWPGIFAYGILLLPKGMKQGERRPVVVCQHGLEGRPTDVSDPKFDSHFYHHFGATLAEEGFITFAPQNPYIGEDHFRIIQRMGHPVKLALFSFILGQHEQILNWLSSLPFVNPGKIGFYGLSYGGKTAVRVPPLLERYALSICSGDFNEWVWKTTTVIAPQSYLLTKEYDMYEFNFANVVNYADLANLLAPRPFMVERGHDDVVGVDEVVAFEYAKVEEFYSRMGLEDNTQIELFNGPHTIHGVGTFEFLRRHLDWPA